MDWPFLRLRPRCFRFSFVAVNSWPLPMKNRMEAAAEETLLTLQQDGPDLTNPRRLKVTAQREGGAAILEFVAKSGDSNIEDQISLLGDIDADLIPEREVSLRLLRHMASDVRHRQYHDIDFVTVRVEVPETNAGQ